MYFFCKDRFLLNKDSWLNELRTLGKPRWWGLWTENKNRDIKNEGGYSKAGESNNNTIIDFMMVIVI